MFHTLAEILKETEPGPSFSQLMHDHLSQLFQKRECFQGDAGTLSLGWSLLKDINSQTAALTDPSGHMTRSLFLSLLLLSAHTIPYRIEFSRCLSLPICVSTCL